MGISIWEVVSLESQIADAQRKVNVCLTQCHTTQRDRARCVDRLWPVSVTDMGHRCQAQQFWCPGGVTILYRAYVTETVRCDVINTGVSSTL